MTDNTSQNAASTKLEAADFSALSSIGFSGKSDIECASEIVMAMIANRLVVAGEVPGALISVIGAIRQATGDAPPAAVEPAPEPVEMPTAAQIKKSITPDALISFLDGKPYKTLKRHLGVNGLSPAQYRARYGLDENYPMVAPSYAAQRSALAKSIGLGKPGGMIKGAEA